SSWCSAERCRSPTAACGSEHRGRHARVLLCNQPNRSPMPIARLVAIRPRFVAGRGGTTFSGLLLLLAVLLFVVATPAWAVQPDEMLADSGLEARARNLSRELRCMVCQNQSIDDSEAPLARDLRLLVRERLKA